MRNCLRLSALRLLITAASVLVVPNALGQSTVDVSVNGRAATSCASGESVALSGSLHLAYSFTTDATTSINTYHVGILSAQSGAGEATQTTYVGENASFAYDFPTTDSPAQITLQLGSRLFSQGSAPSLMLNQPLNITVDTAGNISASVGTSSTACATN